ncbi:MAG: DUF3147 family protein [Candidatus Acidiferrum sp.]
MRIQFHLDAVKKVKWYELGIRFLFGGAITLIAGVLAKRFGPLVGGLFLAFPAIFPASVTLLAKKQSQKKAAKGMNGEGRGKKAAAIEARGTIIGTIGLACFALVVWFSPEAWNSAMVLTLGTVAWLCVSLVIWDYGRKSRHWRHKRKAMPAFAKT